MVSLKVDVQGMRVRNTDGYVSPERRLAIMRQRLGNTSVLRMRPGDNPTQLAEILSQRRPEVTQIALITGPIEIIPTPEMINIPGKVFTMGGVTNSSNKKEQYKEVRLRDYAIGKYPVTNEEFLAFLEAKKLPIPEEVDNPFWRRLPVVVTWPNAVNYCNWLSEVKGTVYRLPTEPEWEYAARGNDGRIYPWGNEEWSVLPSDIAIKLYPHLFPGGTYKVYEVGQAPSVTSPFGVMDMVGSVRQWMSNRYANELAQYGDDFSDVRVEKSYIAVRGYGPSGGGEAASYYMASIRSHSQPDEQNGFRVVEELSLK